VIKVGTGITRVERAQNTDFVQQFGNNLAVI
jgi:hypothetical protein